MMDIKKVILDPLTQIHADVFTDENIIHTLELDQVLKVIDKLKGDAKEYDPSENFKRVHNTITLSGSRGSGKTSFLYTLYKSEELKSDFETIDLIDPTLIEEKGHIFLNIVARIKELIDELVDSEKLSINDEKYEKWYKVLKSLATGLPMLDGINGGLDPSDWNDTTFVMMDGLKRVTGANNLEEKFHQYVQESLNILGKKCFMIAFDDVDTDFAKGWPVLETLRKYLTSPQVITLLSGDLDLYSFVVRKKQWENFGKSLLKNEYDKGTNGGVIYTEEYSELVEKLESQYMMKLLKPEYRITLSTIASKLASKKIEIKIKIQDEELEIEKSYSEYLEKVWNISGKSTIKSYTNFFTSLPLRSQLSLLNALSKSDNEGLNVLNISKAISDIFLSELRTANVDVWELVNGYGLTNIYLLKFLIDNKVLDEASQFFPKLNISSLDGAVTTLGFILSAKIASNPYEIFDYIIRISNIVAKANWNYEGNNDTPNIEHFLSHSRSLFDYGLKKIASLQSAYILSFGEFTPKEELAFIKNEGLIPIKNEQGRNKKGINESDLRIDEIFKNDNSLNYFLGYLPAFSVQDTKGTNSTYYSFYNIIASIGEIIYQNKDEMQDEFRRVSQLREFPLFFNTNQRFQVEDVDEISEEDEVEEGDGVSISEFIQKIQGWNERKNITIPPYLLGRIMVRSIYSFANINLNLLSNVGEYIHRQLVIFLNAILVEEAMEKDGNARLKLTNPTGSDKNFIDNYNNTKTANLEHPFFDFIFNCPIIQAYLDHELFTKLGLNPSLSSSIFSQLKRLSIKGHVVVSSHWSDFVNASIQKVERRVRNTIEDAGILINYFVSNEKTKESITKEDVKKAIKIKFNTYQVRDDMKDGLYDKIKNSDAW